MNPAGNFRAAVIGGVSLSICLTTSLLVQAQIPTDETKPEESVPREYQGFAEDTGHRGVIDDPDGYVNVRSQPKGDAPIVAKVKTGEQFSFDRHEYDPWCKVTLASGKTGWMDAQRILLFFTKTDLPEKPDKDDEIDDQARKNGIDYYAATQGAVQGDVEARKKFFSLGQIADGAAAEEHDGVICVVVHLVGDSALADFLKGQPASFQAMVRNSIDDNVTYPFRSIGYLQRHFPKASKMFFRRELVDWPSPDNRYAVHKKFSDEYTADDSKVTRSEIVEKKTGRVVLDLTKEDVGAGRWKEGEVLWSPDSKRFAFSSTDGTDNKFQIFHLAGDKFVKVNVPAAEDKIPTVVDDPELKDTRFDGEFGVIDPVHWVGPNVIAFHKHLLYSRQTSSDQLDRRYDICMTIGDDGKVTCQAKFLAPPSSIR